MATPEGKVKAQIKKILKERSIYYYCPMQNGYGVVGVPDFICCWNGRFLGIEAKAPGKANNTTPNQKMQIKLINDAGGIAVVIDDPADLVALLDA